jgi:hypothetical protein
MLGHVENRARQKRTSLLLRKTLSLPDTTTFSFLEVSGLPTAILIMSTAYLAGSATKNNCRDLEHLDTEPF